MGPPAHDLPQTACYYWNMKINEHRLWRKHGRRARLTMTEETDTRDAMQGERLKTSLTFKTEHQAYLWTTDRGRSRLIKH